MKNKLPEKFTRGGFTDNHTIMGKIDGIIAYLQEKEDIAKKIRETPEDAPVIDDSEIIRVPDHIVFMMEYSQAHLMNYEQSLYYDPDLDDWCVYKYKIEYIANMRTPMKLVKCSYEDIEVGEFLYMSMDDLEDIKELGSYGLKVSNTECVHWDKGGILHIEPDYSYYYKITPIT